MPVSFYPPNTAPVLKALSHSSWTTGIVTSPPSLRICKDLSLCNCNPKQLVVTNMATPSVDTPIATNRGDACYVPPPRPAPTQKPDIPSDGSGDGLKQPHTHPGGHILSTTRCSPTGIVPPIIDQGLGRRDIKTPLGVFSMRAVLLVCMGVAITVVLYRKRKLVSSARETSHT